MSRPASTGSAMGEDRGLTVLGFDYGLKHIGVAVGQTVTGTATALETVRVRSGKPDWARISALLETWQPDLLVIGEPLNMDGSEQHMTGASRRFSRQLHGRYSLEVELVDERLSSVEARERIERFDPRRTADHPVAAQVLLETWLHDREDSLRRAGPAAGPEDGRED